MIDLRQLLIDCRIALRALPGRPAQALLQRVEMALTEVAKDGGGNSANSQTAQQVALAWQTVARGLKHSHGELYEELHTRVMSLLGTRTLYEPSEELLILQKQSEEFDRERQRLQARVERAQERQRSVQAQLDDLHKALAAAVPESAGGRDAQAQALSRLDSLVASANSPDARDGKGRAGKEGPAPSRPVLERVADGEGSFTKEQRDWIIGEALGLTGWAFTPVELIEKGDQWLATLVLEKGAPA